MNKSDLQSLNCNMAHALSPYEWGEEWYHNSPMFTTCCNKEKENIHSGTKCLVYVCKVFAKKGPQNKTLRKVANKYPSSFLYVRVFMIQMNR